MKTELLILGHLLRHGPLHGYRLKSLIDDGAGEFAEIKLPTLYYHLERLERAEHVISEAEQEGKRPERTVYTITESGKLEFTKLMEKALATDYQAEFLLDAVFYFGDAIPIGKLIARLRNKKKFLEEAQRELEENREQMLARFSGAGTVMAKAIHRHHLLHYRAEIAWLDETINELDRSEVRRRLS